ncbi:MAG: glutamate-5-semialdehyde dehydrogenase [Dehalococcoidia bacterium]|nr:glutamate-5-semialdehyde dehydrogenase [Dehalococcoidia bacterium]MDP7469559.1 glutamate-5-semialdehyde dehydrogenase [Dehalococcoidia bacterium]
MDSSAIGQLETQGRAAKNAARDMAFASTDAKNRALGLIADGLINHIKEIGDANSLDMEAARASDIDEAMLDRLLLNSRRLEGMAADVRTLASLPDPVGEVFDMRTMPNGLLLGRQRVPIGLIGTIYESRPNVTIDISSLCIKSGNAVILRGGREAIHSNRALVAMVADACREAGLPDGAVQFVDNTDRSLVGHMLKMRQFIDLFIPRGGAGLIRLVLEEAAMPVVAGGIGVCHTYVDRNADLDMAVRIVYNAKVQRPTVCNALDTVLVHREAAPAFLQALAPELEGAGVEVRADERVMELLRPIYRNLTPAAQEDWGKEFLSLVAAVRVVDSLDDALEHIRKYGSGHSEAIITEDYSAATRFQREVDAACVYINASTRFTDGGQFGLGAEVGISTGKLHARGPMGLRELTTYKWIVFGSGQVRLG